MRCLERACLLGVLGKDAFHVSLCTSITLLVEPYRSLYTYIQVSLFLFFRIVVGFSPLEDAIEWDRNAWPAALAEPRRALQRSEAKFFRRILPKYYEHHRQNPDSFLVRFCGMYMVKFEGKKIPFLVMNW